MHLSLVTLAAAAAALAVAQTTPSVSGTSSLSSVTCGSNRYTAQQITDATAEACRLAQAGQQLGNNNYPHQFNNREALVFAASGPYQEFPVIAGGTVYAGRSPGPDRIVFKSSSSGSGRCEYVGSMTHTGAPTNNGFVLCDEVKGASSSATKTTASATKSTTGAGTATADASSAARTSGSAASGGMGAGWMLGAVGLIAPLMVVV